MKYAIGLGSNMGSRRAFLDAAIKLLHHSEHMTVIKQSRVISSPALTLSDDHPADPPYLNQVILIETTLDPESLLKNLLRTEQQLGRIRNEKWGSRTIDLDILWWEQGSFSTDQLSVPHPELNNRLFVLEPLLEVLPKLSDELFESIQSLKQKEEKIDICLQPRLNKKSHKNGFKVTVSWNHCLQKSDAFCTCLIYALPKSQPYPTTERTEVLCQNTDEKKLDSFYQDVTDKTHKLLMGGYVVHQICINGQNVYWILEKQNESPFKYNFGFECLISDKAITINSSKLDDEACLSINND